MQKKIVFMLLCILLTHGMVKAQVKNAEGGEQYRPQIHFTPRAHWMNDPNGMVFYKGVYHLFFQYYPDASVWGPMHWAHATSRDLLHWVEQPIALYPDSLGFIFSGSVVVDKNNTSGLGKKGKVPLVAIFTHHSMEGEKANRNDFQNQSIAYSLDDGITWTKYAGNPVLRNPGIVDFRDPKVMWYEAQKKWVMTLATKDRITFYSSPNLKDWTKETEFGETLGAHGGVWECPDLFPLNDNGKKVWALLVSINPGGPNKGSATQYFLGDFDGHTFTPNSAETKWIDYGTDNYAGVTWSNTGNRKIFLGWMSNWQYATVVPTTNWRSAMTLPRELQLKHVGNNLIIASQPVSELSGIQSKSIVLENLKFADSLDVSKKAGAINFPCQVNLKMDNANNFSLSFSNDLGEVLLVGYDKKSNQYFIDRSKSGKIDFEKGFAARHTAPRFTSEFNMNISLVIDVSSVELFADDGLTTMTEIFFPTKPYNKILLRREGKTVLKKLEYIKLKSTLPKR